jgi:dihydrofolate reductase
MARLTYLMHTSLDGYIEDEQGDFAWTAPDAELNGYINALMSSVGTYLYGRRMYDAMVFWEKDYAAHDLPQFSRDFATMWQAAEKIVYSRMLVEARSARTRIEREFEPDAVRRLKADAGRDLSISGPGLAAHALKAGLVDEVLMFVHPVLVGGGKRFFPSGVRAKLGLIEERAFTNEVVALRYAVRG